MNPSPRHFASNLRRSTWLVLAIFSFCCPLLLHAQTVTRVGNADIAAHVLTLPKQGRFWITGGSAYNDTLKFLYASGPGFITSNIVFRTVLRGDTNYYCNLPTGSLPQRPLNPNTGAEIPYRAFDTSYMSNDTLALLYRNLDGFTITVRFMPEKRRTIHDRGSDMLIEFDYVDSPFGPPGELGIMMMLDTYNNNATATSGGGTGDNASILTDVGYFPSGNFGRTFRQRFDSMPRWYHIGNFRDTRPLNTIYPIHRLGDTSHGGRRLTAPSLVSIGSWLDFRRVGWEPPANVGSQIFNDAATIVRWEGLRTAGKVVTAFGLSDREGNNMYTCRDSALFVDIRTHRRIEQKAIGGPYTPAKFDVEMWVTNTEDRFGNNVSIEMGNPIITSPRTAGRLTLDPSSPRTIAVQLGPRETRKIGWTMLATPGAENDPDSIDAKLEFRYIYGNGSARVFRQACAPTITLRDARRVVTPPDRDTLAPVIERDGGGTDPSVYWEFSIYDRHPGYRLDTGIDMIEVDQTRARNIGYEINGGRQCDTTSTIRPRFMVLDVRKEGWIHFKATDCAGNVTWDSLFYTPPPDTMAPTLVRRGGATTPNVYWDIDAFDRHAGYRFDSGIDRVVVDENRSSNFGFTMEGGTRCDTGTTLKPRFTVIDDELPGIVHFEAFDCAGNVTADSIVYRGDRSNVPGEKGERRGDLSIVSVAPNPVDGGSGREVIVTLGRFVPGRIAVSLVSIEGIEIRLDEVAFDGDTRLRVVLPGSLPGGRYQLRVSDEKGSDAIGVTIVR